MAEFTIERLTGKDLEAAVQERSAEYKAARMAHVTKCGVHAVMTMQDGKPVWQVIQSIPDFEGVNSQGQQFIFDCKVCSDSSFDLSQYRFEQRKPKGRQLKHMLERSAFGVPCFFMIHWNAREMKTFREPSVSYLFPVSDQMDFWERFSRGEVKSINRKSCEELGTVIEWNVFEGCRKPRPDFLAAMSEHFLKQMV